jgi:hypothetical protein
MFCKGKKKWGKTIINKVKLSSIFECVNKFSAYLPLINIFFVSLQPFYIHQGGIQEVYILNHFSHKHLQRVTRSVDG